MKHTRIIICLAVGVLSGCVASQSQLRPKAAKQTIIKPRSQTIGQENHSPLPEVVREGRYLLVNVDPTLAQRDPLSQIVDIHIPDSLTPTVEQALHYVLRQSGYSLCTADAVNRVLYQQSLPAIHYHLGPIRLRTALQIIAGSAWQMQIDPVQRTICYQLREGVQPPKVTPVIKGGWLLK